MDRLFVSLLSRPLGRGSARSLDSAAHLSAPLSGSLGVLGGHGDLL